MTKQLGRYGQIYLEYLKTNKKIMSSILKENGTLHDHCYEREQELKQLAETIDNQLRKANPRLDTDSFIMAVQYENSIANMVHELVLDNL